MNKIWILALVFAALSFQMCVSPKNGIEDVQITSQDTVFLGVDMLRVNGFKVLSGKRVALVTNPTGVDRNLKSTIDILFEADEVNLVALFGPEHGVRGNFSAGDHVEDQKDEITGLPMYSLYGKTRKTKVNSSRIFNK